MTFKWIFCIVIFIGGILKVETVWNFGDVLNALMAVPNIIAIVLLGNVVINVTKKYFSENKAY